MKRVIRCNRYLQRGIDFEGAVGMSLRNWLDTNGLDIGDIEIPDMPYVLYQTRDLVANLDRKITGVPYTSSYSPLIQVPIKNPNRG